VKKPQRVLVRFVDDDEFEGHRRGRLRGDRSRASGERQPSPWSSLSVARSRSLPVARGARVPK
jgi:hypothetical protein